MGKNRFVEPSTVRVDLSDGDWVEIKERLSYGEQRRLTGSGVTRIPDPTTGKISLDLDLEKHSILRMQTWLADWSFADRNGRAVPISAAAIAALDGDTAQEIDTAISLHIMKLESARSPESVGQMIENARAVLADLEELKNGLTPPETTGQS